MAERESDDRRPGRLGARIQPCKEPEGYNCREGSRAKKGTFLLFLWMGWPFREGRKKKNVPFLFFLFSEGLSGDFREGGRRTMTTGLQARFSKDR